MSTQNISTGDDLRLPIKRLHSKVATADFPHPPNRLSKTGKLVANLEQAISPRRNAHNKLSPLIAISRAEI
eukprot:scaffold605781_cov46-Prasinocladus_malaysianus.AAC.1